MQWSASFEGGPQRVNHAACVVGDQIYSFGGYNSDEPFDSCHTMDVHVFDTNNFKWRPIRTKSFGMVPKKCYGHTVVTFHQKIYLFGGRNKSGASNDLYCYDTESSKWEQIDVTGSVPRKVDGHSACMIGSYMYVFGGFEDSLNKCTNSVHRLNIMDFTWEKVKTKGLSPTPRDFHTASVIGDRMYIFGGRNFIEHDVKEEIYEDAISFLDTKTMKWDTPVCHSNPPTGRRSHSAVVYNDEIYIIGGFGETKYHFNDIYKYNPESSVWCKMHPNGEPPSPRRRHCTCVVGDQLYLFGGSSPQDQKKYAENYSNDDMAKYLIDHSDLHLLDFFPSLKRLSQLQIIKNNITLKYLPKKLQIEIKNFTTDKMLSRNSTTDKMLSRNSTTDKMMKTIYTTYCR